MADLDIERGAQTLQQFTPQLVLLMFDLEGDEPRAVRIFQYPDILEGGEQILAQPPPARRHQMADVILGAALASMQNVQDSGALPRFALQIQERIGHVANRLERICGNKRCDFFQIVRMLCEQALHVLLRQRALLAVEGTAAHMQDEGVIAQHVAVTDLHRAHAKIIFLAIPQAEGFRVKQADFIQQRAPDEHAKSHAVGISG